LDAAHVTPIAQCDHPVVETSLLSGSTGSVLLLANYTYQPITNLTIDLRLDHVNSVSSAAGVAVQFEKTKDGIRLRIPLEWTDALLIQ